MSPCCFGEPIPSDDGEGEAIVPFDALPKDGKGAEAPPEGMPGQCCSRDCLNRLPLCARQVATHVKKKIGLAELARLQHLPSAIGDHQPHQVWPAAELVAHPGLRHQRAGVFPRLVPPARCRGKACHEAAEGHGGWCAPEDLRRFNQGRGSSSDGGVKRRAANTCNAFLDFAHANLAEPLAECLVEESSEYIAREALPIDAADYIPTEAGLDNVVSRVSLSLDQKETRWLTFQHLKDLYITMVSWVCGSVEHDEVQPCSAFLRVWQVWAASKKLRIRQQGQHARCTLCAELSERLSKTHEVEEQAEIIATRERHLASMFADRDLEYRLNSLSEASTARTCSFHGRVLKVDMDGMDQAKFKCPRNISNAHSLNDMWRPMIHIVGIVNWGFSKLT